jgi:isopenicillin N synthase-like dioxygenase
MAARAFNIGEFVDGRAQQPLPKGLAEQEATIGRFAENCHALCNRLLQLFALGLEVSITNPGTGSDAKARTDKS